MILYHGGYCPIETPHIIQGRFTKDFGDGFYCTQFKEQAIRWSNRFETPVISIYKYEPNNDLATLEFTDMTEDWLDFIVACRGGNRHEYDIVTGAMANDQIFNYIADYISGILTKEQFWVLAKFKRPTHQISFNTNRALRNISFQSSEEANNERAGR
jgi:hypothetical protein